MKKEQFFYGGQAVIEGVFMRGPKHYAVAVRQPDGNIRLRTSPLKAKIYTSKLCTKPLLRGVFGLMEMMHLGYDTIRWSAGIQLNRNDNSFGKIMKGSMLIGVLVALALFVGIPFLVASLFVHHIHSINFTLLEGFVRIVLLLGYLRVIRFLPDVNRLFSYHGAEHKSINCLEKEEELTVTNVKNNSRLHPRCGTGLVLIIALLSTIIFAPLAIFPLPLMFLFRFLLIPLIASLSYEGVRLLNMIKTTRIGKLFLIPVLQTQKLTTNEPDVKMMETAIIALTACLRAQEEGFDNTEKQAGTRESLIITGDVPFASSGVSVFLSTLVQVTILVLGLY